MNVVCKEDGILGLSPVTHRKFELGKGSIWLVLIGALNLALFSCGTQLIDVLAIQQKTLDRALFLYIFIRKALSIGVRTAITFLHIRKFCKRLQGSCD